MEKKSTKIAYGVAFGIFVVLMVILGVSYPDGVYGTFWSLLPPIVAIVLALISKEVYSSLFLGVLAGALLYTNFGIWDTVVALVGSEVGLLCVLADSWDMGIIIFLVLLGIMVDLMNKGGGSAAFGRWAKKAVKTRKGAQLLTMLLGVLNMGMSIMGFTDSWQYVVKGGVLLVAVIFDVVSSRKSGKN